MPGNITPAAPSQVMPQHLATAFHEELHLEADLNVYPDGSSDRNALALNNRRYFSIQRTLMPAEWTALWQFYLQQQGRAFYFYNPRETVPPFSFDPTGQNTVGRYTVVFDSAWSETYTNQRRDQTGFGASVQLALREIA
jgi:hypothetical protein